MSKQTAPSLPETPSFQSDPNVGWSQDVLKDQSNYLINGLTSDQGLSGQLGEATSTNPMITQLTLQALQSQLAPSYRTGLQNITNTLEANNQLTGSTTASALGNYEGDYLAQLTAAGANAGIADINRALQNRVSLYGVGLNAAQGVGQTGLNNQSQTNQFALQNYENQVSAALINQPQQRGGFMGALTGALGGGIGGFALGGPYGAAVGAGLGGLSGGFGQSGSGGQFLGAGASLFGNRNSGIPGITSGGGEQIYNPIYQPLNSSSNLLGNLSNYYPYGLN
ncbi:hypothetical protein KW791_00555 [Candidatus Parcubacteria bacterium]|nr:hypothetical protein [Candidatus Parcubacteria bacterium]